MEEGATAYRPGEGKAKRCEIRPFAWGVGTRECLTPASLHGNLAPHWLLGIPLGLFDAVIVSLHKSTNRESPHVLLSEVARATDKSTTVAYLKVVAAGQGPFRGPNSGWAAAIPTSNRGLLELRTRTPELGT